MFVESRTISTAFQHAILPDVLDAEVRSDPAITTAFDGLSTDEDLDVCRFVFQVEPSTAEKAALDALCAAHPSLAAYKARKIAALGVEVTAYHGQHYDQPQRESFVMYYQTAIEDGLVNRAAYVRTAMDWTSALQQHYVTCAGTVLAATDHAGVDAVVLDLPTWEASHPDPGVTIPAVLMIPD